MARKPQQESEDQPVSGTPDNGGQFTEADNSGDPNTTQAEIPTPILPAMPFKSPKSGTTSAPGQPSIPRPDFADAIASDVPRVTFWQRLGKALRRVLGWIVAAIFGIVLGVLIFLIAPAVSRDVLTPIRSSQADITRLDAEVDLLGTQLTELNVEQSTDRQSQDAALSEVQAAAERRVAEAETRMAEAESRLAEAEARLREAEDALAEQAEQITALQESLDAASAQLAALEQELPGVEEYAAFNRQLLLMRVWQELLNARLQLLENNPGEALDILSEADLLLEEAYLTSTPEQQAALSPVLERLARVLENITENPFAATGDLEIALHDLGLLIIPPEESTPADVETPVDADESGSAEETPTPEP